MNQVKLHTKQDLLVALSANREAIKSYGVNSLGFFGSFSKGTVNDQSDVDLLVDFVPEKEFWQFHGPLLSFRRFIWEKSGDRYSTIIK